RAARAHGRPALAGTENPDARSALSIAGSIAVLYPISSCVMTSRGPWRSGAAAAPRKLCMHPPRRLAPAGGGAQRVVSGGVPSHARSRAWAEVQAKRMALHSVVLPKTGVFLEDVLLTEWLQPEGAAVAKGDALLTFETDKVTTEVQSDHDGWLH